MYFSPAKGIYIHKNKKFPEEQKEKIFYGGKTKNDRK